ncbi:MAG: putative DNA-binding protein (MmcQ/YjbR family) [Hyphomicrobiaceae bacterium]|jgi:predicted DNA-binding protein (MmcQ/YjbR family)
MYGDDARELLLARPGATEATPFGPEVLVYKVAGKMFATLGVDEATDTARMNLKCDPDRAEQLRGEHEGILPGYHMNKRHWNTLVLDGGLPRALVEELIEHSWQLVVAGLSRKARQELWPQ